jgi:chaperonin GroES
MAAKKKVIKKVAKKNQKTKKTVKAKAKPVKKIKKSTGKVAAKKSNAKKTPVKKAPAKKKTPPVKPAAKAPVKAQVKAAVPVDYSKAITPLLDRVVVKVLSGERMTAGGLYIPDSASMASGYLKAKVLAIGTGIKTKKGSLRPLDVQVGDTVLFSEYSGTKVQFNSEELHIINESDVMGVVQE